MDLRCSSNQLWMYYIALVLMLTGCQPPLNNDAPTYSQNPEGSYCGAAQATSYSGSTTTVSGTATFEYRALSLANGLSGNPVSLGTTYAEVHIVDSAGVTVQCGETNATGAFSLVIPQVAGSYTVQVLSRSLTNKVKASVLKDIYDSIPYIVETGFSVNAGQSTVNGLTVVASARGSVDSEIPGAAFNILADIFWANEYLRENTSNASFVADKVSVYWKAGFNPYSYFNAPNTLASFYIASENRLYILGGKNDDVKSSDTDHFDDSIVLHEYGHFLEAQYSRPSSPGGSHNGDFIIDPRLAWSEGWANYFQAAVQNGVLYNASYTGPRKGTGGFKRYVDTLGFTGDSVEGSGCTVGSNCIQINRDLSETNAAATRDKAAANEGVFREFSISRTLYKTLTNAGGLPFAALWDAFVELRDSNTPAYRFTNFGLYNSVLQTILNTNYSGQSQVTWNGIITEENQIKNTSLYGRYTITGSPGGGSPACATTPMTPVADASYSYLRSNQLMSNDFYTFYHDGTSKQIGLKATSTGNVIDMNLYLYADGYYYSEEIQEAQAGFSNSTMVRKSKTVNINNSSETEVVDLTGLSAGYYMINVKASTMNKSSAYLGGGTANYYIYIGTSSTVTTCLVPN
ncbi:hypothetical protein [Bdellovibrio sp. HCB337]|uniref:hypothetical protein n=1 Tax=Bdellovibrio sp. HCB337 TaxID=3394358 RepID=UPI0039A50339